MRCVATLKLKSPVILDRLAPFDSVVAYLACTEKEHELGVPPGGLPQEVVQQIIGTLPIRKHPGADFYMASTAIFPDGPVMEQSITFPRVTNYNKFDEILRPGDMDLMVKGKGIGGIRGPKKAHMVTYSAYVVDEVRYVVETDDRERLNNLLNTLFYLGKKSSLGFGEIEGAVKIGKRRGVRTILTPTDMLITRPAPAGLDYKAIEEPFFYNRILPPYWRGQGGVLCGMATM